MHHDIDIWRKNVFKNEKKVISWFFTDNFVTIRGTKSFRLNLNLALFPVTGLPPHLVISRDPRDTNWAVTVIFVTWRYKRIFLWKQHEEKHHLFTGNWGNAKDVLEVWWRYGSEKEKPRELIVDRLTRNTQPQVLPGRKPYGCLAVRLKWSSPIGDHRISEEKVWRSARIKELVRDQYFSAGRKVTGPKKFYKGYELPCEALKG